MMQPTEPSGSCNFGPDPSEEAAPSENPLFDYLTVIAKRKKMIIACTIAAAVLSVLYSVTLPNIYTAKTMIVPGDDDKGAMGAMMAQMGGLASVAGVVGRPTKTELYVTMLKSETIKDPIIDSFKLMESYGTKLRSAAYKVLDQCVAISVGKKDGVLTITVDDEDPKRAAAIANAYVDELGKLVAGLSMTGAGKNRAFLEERLSTAKADLVQAEAAMKDFQSKNKMLDVPEQAKASIVGISQLRGQLVANEVALGTLQRQFTDNSQEIKTAKAIVASMRSQIAQMEGTGGHGSIPSVGSMPQLGQEYVRLLRDFKIQETLVELLTKQNEIVKINEAKNVSPFQLLQVAKVPEVKSRPVRSKMVKTATLVGLVASLMLAFAWEGLVKMPEDQKLRWKNLLKTCKA